MDTLISLFDCDTDADALDEVVLDLATLELPALTDPPSAPRMVRDLREEAYSAAATEPILRHHLNQSVCMHAVEL